MSTTSIEKQPSRGLVIAAFAAVYILWGSTYIAMLIAIRNLPPLVMAGSRFIIAGTLLLLFLLFRGERLPKWRSVLNISLSGILMLFFGTGAVAWVEQYIPSGLAATIVATLPLWFVVMDKRQWQYHFSNKGIIAGLIIGFAGVLTLFADRQSFSFSGNPMKLASLFILLGGTICWATGSLYSKYKAVDGSTGMKAAIQMLAAGICFFVISPLIGEFHHVHQVPLTTIAAILYLVVFGSLVGYMSYIWLLSVRSPALVGTYAYVNPVVAVFLGWLLADEKIRSQQIIALAVILGGVLLVALSKERKLK